MATFEVTGRITKDDGLEGIPDLIVRAHVTAPTPGSADQVILPPGVVKTETGADGSFTLAKLDKAAGAEWALTVQDANGVCWYAITFATPTSDSIDLRDIAAANFQPLTRSQYEILSQRIDDADAKDVLLDSRIGAIEATVSAIDIETSTADFRADLIDQLT